MNSNTRERAEAVVELLEQNDVDVRSFSVTDSTLSLEVNTDGVDVSDGDGGIDPAGLGGGTVKR